MDSGTITALAAIAGSASVAFSSLAGAWIKERYHDRRDLLYREITRREALYAEFITETARHFISAAEHNLTEADPLAEPYALCNRIRLTATPAVLGAAEGVIAAIVEAYSRPNLTAQEVQSMAGSGVDPLRDFSAACRGELEDWRKQLG